MSKTWILVVCDDLWHPAEIIERGLNALPQDKYDFEKMCIRDRFWKASWKDMLNTTPLICPKR